MLKAYLSEHKISIYHLAQLSSIPYSTLNDFVNQKLTIENLKSGHLKAISDALGMSMDEVYQLCSYKRTVFSRQYGIAADVVVKQKSYYLEFEKNGKHYDEEIIAVKKEATQNIQILAEWKLDELLAMITMEEAYESLYPEKKR